MSVQKIPELERLALEIGSFIEYWGFKQVHGRIWVHLVLAQSPLDASELIERLGVSKALVSLSLKELLNFNVIRLAGKSSRGTVLYEVNPAVGDVIGHILRSRERMMLANIKSSFYLLQSLKKDQLNQAGVNSQRLNVIDELIQNADAALEAFIGLNAFNISNFKLK